MNVVNIGRVSFRALALFHIKELTLKRDINVSHHPPLNLKQNQETKKVREQEVALGFLTEVPTSLQFCASSVLYQGGKDIRTHF